MLDAFGLAGLVFRRCPHRSLIASTWTTSSGGVAPGKPINVAPVEISQKPSLVITRLKVPPSAAHPSLLGVNTILAVPVPSASIWYVPERSYSQKRSAGFAPAIGVAEELCLPLVTDPWPSNSIKPIPTR